AKAVEATKAFIKLSHDVGGTGVKVKPDRFHKGVEKEKTIEQIGKALNQLGEYADGWGQEIRLEVHGQCSQLPTIRKIMDVAQNKNVGVCWNSNGQDLQGKGLVHNFDLVKKRFGATAHVRELEDKNYPYEKLMELFVKMDYAGWVMLEARGKPRDRVAALSQQLKLFNSMVANGRKALGKKG
ncbi:MAG: xylose isomerase, partial [Planctomycetes bacterium]|nr:xylose isomerase [Planctomycetota bacterium]